MKDLREVLGIVLIIALAYALCSGVSVNGRHYQVTCDDHDGVSVHWDTPDASTGGQQ